MQKNSKNPAAEKGQKIISRSKQRKGQKEITVAK